MFFYDYVIEKKKYYLVKQFHRSSDYKCILLRKKKIKIQNGADGVI